MTRRDFLKRIMGMTAGLIILYITRLLSRFQERPASPASKRIAKFYRQADDLAG